MADPTVTTDVADVAWDLEPLVDGQGEAGVERQLDEAQQRAEAFAAQHGGKIDQLDGAGLRDAMLELAELQELVGRAGSYAALNFSTDTADPARGALMQKVQERGTVIETTLLFVELEWAALDDDKVEELLAGEGLDFCRHYLQNARRYRPHLLSEPEEKILAEKRVTGGSAWERLFSEQTSAIEVDIEGVDEPVALDVALSRLLSPDREVRRSVAASVTSALQPSLRTRGYIFNTLLADKTTDDRLRNYPHWLAARNLANEASDESVEALVSAVRARYDIPQRWYRLKAKLLGIDKLADYDRSCELGDDATVGWDEARELVLDAYGSFSGELGDLARGFFDGNYVDAPVRPGKRGGAFCAYTTPSQHPYVLLNWTSKRRDVLTLAHELGHGVHAALARPQGVYHQGTPLTLAETASVFGETIVFGRLLEETTGADERLALLAGALDDAIATVFRQVAMNRFEHLVHTARREEGELSIDRFGELWHESQSELFGDSVEVTEGYRTWWSYIPHFIGTPGYVYAYAYGQLLALSVYQRYEETGAAFVPSYLELLSAGGSRSPEALGELVGIELADPGFWDKGLALVEQRLLAAEQAADAAGR
jgi:oligoendopeptidase F